MTVREALSGVRWYLREVVGRDGLRALRRAPAPRASGRAGDVAARLRALASGRPRRQPAGALLLKNGPRGNMDGMSAVGPRAPGARRCPAAAGTAGGRPRAARHGAGLPRRAPRRRPRPPRRGRGHGRLRRASRSAPASRASTRGATPWRPGRPPSLVRDARQEPQAAAHPFVAGDRDPRLRRRGPHGDRTGRCPARSAASRARRGRTSASATSARSRHCSRMAAAQLGAATDRHASASARTSRPRPCRR